MSQEPQVTSKSDSGRHDGGSGLASADLDSSDLDNSDPSLVLRTVGLSKSFYLHERRLSVPAFDDVSLSVRCGRFTAVTGPSGSGKSSLLSCIYRTYLPTAGAAFYFPTSGEACDLACVPDEKILQLRSSELSFVTQFLHFLPRKSALEVVARPLLDRSVNQTEAEAAASRVLERVNLPPRLWGISPATFSGGEKQGAGSSLFENLQLVPKGKSGGVFMDTGMGSLRGAVAVRLLKVTPGVCSLHVAGFFAQDEKWL